MSFELQTIEAFQEAWESASELLVAEGVRPRPIALDEAFIMQAASHVLQTSTEFYGYQIARITHIYHTSVYRRLNTFEVRDNLLESFPEEARGPGNNLRRLYLPTDLGGEVLDYFQRY
jgi:hypothetical protein